MGISYILVGECMNFFMLEMGHIEGLCFNYIGPSGRPVCKVDMRGQK